MYDHPYLGWNRTRNICNGCNNGFYGNQSEQSCNWKCVGCDQFNAQCTSCVVGTYGDECEKQCQVHRLSCDRQTGKCHDCLPGVHGDDCHLACSTGCLKTCSIDKERVIAYGSRTLNKAERNVWQERMEMTARSNAKLTAYHAIDRPVSVTSVCLVYMVMTATWPAQLAA